MDNKSRPPQAREKPERTSTDEILPGPDWPRGKVGYVALLGRPNSGKSTLLNTLLSFHLAPVSHRPQTTRKRLLGAFSAPGMQVLFMDCPGFHEGADALDELMLQTVQRTVREADIVLCIADAARKPGPEEAAVAAVAAESGRPVVVAVNKIDLAGPGEQERMERFYRERIPDAPVVRISATDRSSLDPLLDALRERLPEGPFLFDPDFLTDSPERALGAELIRETLLELLKEEVPHAAAVVIETWEEHADQRVIHASIYVERASQKGIVIGRGGRMLAAIRKRAEQKLTGLVGVPVRLHLWVKVAQRWRKKRRWIREFGVA